MKIRLMQKYKMKASERLTVPEHQAKKDHQLLMSKACKIKETNCSNLIAKNKNQFKKETCNSTHRGAYLNPHFNCNTKSLFRNPLASSLFPSETELFFQFYLQNITPTYTWAHFLPSNIPSSKKVSNYCNNIIWFG